jgi:hypothetical protein
MKVKQEMWVVYNALHQSFKMLHACVNGNREMSTADPLGKFSVLAGGRREGWDG